MQTRPKKTQESNETPNEKLQLLIDQDKAKRSLWQRTEDATPSEWESSKYIANVWLENSVHCAKTLQKA